MPKRDPTKEKFWRRVLRQWRRSGVTGRDFCAQHGLSEPSFYAWRRELARRDQQQSTATTNSLPPLTQARSAAAAAPAPASTMPPTAAAATPAFVQLAIPTSVAPPSAIEVVLAQGRRLQVRPGFNADLLRQLLRV